MRFSSAALLLPCLDAALAAPSARGGPVVDLGYARYKGIANATIGYNQWFGIKFAAPPVGNLRWRAPQAPLAAPGIQDATTHPLQCPQGGFGGIPIPPSSSSEDCLTLDMYSPIRATPTSSFPVVVYIHGGGYDLGDASGSEPPAFLQLANKDVVYLTINYRLGLFGFLAGKAVKANGSLNAGLLDQQFALQWVQQHIRVFGGNPKDVTIWGESAGGGSVLQLIIANGGNTQPPLFVRGVANSPSLTLQYNFDHPIPEALFKNLTDLVGCTGSAKVMACLRAAPFDDLENANVAVGEAGLFGTFAWLPVIDGTYIRQRPSVALSQGKINGQSLIVTHNQNDGLLFAPTDLTPQNFSVYVERFVPTADAQLVQRIVNQYPVEDFTTQLDRTANLLQDIIFVCPSYWMASGFSDHGRPSFRGVWDVAPALHAMDLSYDFAPDISALQSFTHFQNWVGMITSFIRFGDPNVENLNPRTNPRFPLWNSQTRLEKHFNITATNVSDPFIQKADQTRFQRCQFWLSVSAVVGQ